MKERIGSVFFMTLLMTSGFVWSQLLRRWLKGLPLLDAEDARPTKDGRPTTTRAKWQSAPELAVVYVVLYLVIMGLVNQFSKSSNAEPQPGKLISIVISVATGLGLTLVLPMGLIASGNSLPSFGWSISRFGSQIRVGIIGFLAAVLPMAVSMLVTLPFRGRETQHSLLKLLLDSPDLATVSLIVISAVFVAPLAEELQFRVVLQGWLTTIFPAKVAIPFVAILFGLVHGWQNGAALLPLALILGYVFHQRHSYIAVVVIHALFNATMLVLQLLNS